jgi:hypothetical protein
MGEPPICFEFIETLIFTKRLEAIASREVLFAIQADLLEDPERWPVIRGTHGARKGRVADPGKARSKSGSFRYLYIYLAHLQQIYLILVFGKDEQDNLSPAQTRLVASFVEAIRRERK